MIFYKYQGAGNDFLIADNRDGSITVMNGVLRSSEEGQKDVAISQLCDRRYGVGADGLMLLESSDDYDFRMNYFNSDGFRPLWLRDGSSLLHLRLPPSF